MYQSQNRDAEDLAVLASLPKSLDAPEEIDFNESGRYRYRKLVTILKYLFAGLLIVVALMVCYRFITRDESSSDKEVTDPNAYDDLYDDDNTGDDDINESLSLPVYTYNKYGNISDSTFKYPFLETSLLMEPYKDAYIDLESTGSPFTFFENRIRVMTQRIVRRNKR